MIFVISGPSGVGKTTLIDLVLTKEKYQKHLQKIITCTTRKPRKGEIDGVDYFFISNEEFNSMDNSMFFGFTKTYQNVYCIKKNTVDQIIKLSKFPIFIVNYDGLIELKKLYQNVVSIFISISNQADLYTRLCERKTETIEKINIRLASAKFEISKANEYDYTIINDDLDSSCARLKKIFDQYL